MKIKYIAKTNKGRVRRANEDYFFAKMVLPEEYLFIVADGMGGHQAGDVASKLGTDTFVSAYKNYRNQSKDIVESLRLAIEEANKKILELALRDNDKRGMGTTFTAIVLKDYVGYIVHIGDSRIYIIRNNKMQKLTKDHTFVEKMLEEGKISKSDARNHPQKNILYMSLGVREYLTPQIIENLQFEDGDILLLCSDGLTNMIEDKTIKEIIYSTDIDSAVNLLIDLANRNGGTDNITLEVIQFGNYRDDETEPIDIAKYDLKNKGKVKKYGYWIFLVLILIFLMLIFYLIR